jgi:hypothetical protein
LHIGEFVAQFFHLATQTGNLRAQLFVLVVQIEVVCLVRLCIDFILHVVQARTDIEYRPACLIILEQCSLRIQRSKRKRGR